jgi:AbiU2
MLQSNKRRELSEAQFERVFREVRTDINALQLHDKVFSGVMENLTRYPLVGSNFPAFFGAFYAAMHTDLIIRLGRIYDPEGTGRQSCTLARCLHVLRDSPQFFTDGAIAARLSEDYRQTNPNYLSFHRPNRRQIDADLDRIGEIREKLINLRHKLYAHKDLETVLGKTHEFLSSHKEIKELIAVAHEIWNRHSLIWDASTHSDKTIGEDDYNWLFNCLRRGMKIKSLVENREFEQLRKRITALRNTGS